MKIKLLCILTLFVSINSFSASEVNHTESQNEVSQHIVQDVLETANLMDEINLLKLKLEKEKLNKSLNKELLSNIEIKKEIDKYHSITKKKVNDPADGPFNPKGVKLLSVTSLQNSHKMAVFSFYGRKYNRSENEIFKGFYISINNEYVVFKDNAKHYDFGY